MDTRSKRLNKIAAKAKEAYFDSMDTGMNTPDAANVESNRNLISAMSYTMLDLSNLKKFLSKYNAQGETFKFIQTADDPVSLMRTYKFFPDFTEMDSSDFSKAQSYVKRLEKHISVMKASLSKGERGI